MLIRFIDGLIWIAVIIYLIVTGAGIWLWIFEFLKVDRPPYL